MEFVNDRKIEVGHELHGHLQVGQAAAARGTIAHAATVVGKQFASTTNGVRWKAEVYVRCDFDKPIQMHVAGGAPAEGRQRRRKANTYVGPTFVDGTEIKPGGGPDVPAYCAQVSDLVRVRPAVGLNDPLLFALERYVELEPLRRLARLLGV